MPPRTLSPDDVEKFRAELCAAAERLFAERGYAGVTLRALAVELDCSPMTPYRYFDNKEAIFEAVRTDAFRRFGDEVGASMIGTACPIERFRKLSRCYVGFAVREPHAYRVMFAMSDTAGQPLGPDDLDHHQELKVGWSHLVENFEEGVREGVFEGDPTTLANIAWLSAHGLVSLALANKLIMGRDLDQLIEPMVNLFLRGALAPQHAARFEEER